MYNTLTKFIEEMNMFPRKVVVVVVEIKIPRESLESDDNDYEVRL